MSLHRREEPRAVQGLLHEVEGAAPEHGHGQRHRRPGRQVAAGRERRLARRLENDARDVQGRTLDGALPREATSGTALVVEVAHAR